MMTQRANYLLALLYAIVIGFSFLFTKLALQFSDPLDMLAFRFTLSFFVLAIPVSLGWVKLDWHNRKKWRLLPLGLLYPTAFFGFQAFGLNFTPSSEAGIFQATSPIFTLILSSLLLSERTSWIQNLSVLSSVVGVIFIMVMNGASVHSTGPLGITLLLISAFALSMYSVSVRKLKDGYSTLQMSYVMLLVGCIFFNVLAIGKHAIAGTINKMFEPFAQPMFLISLLYIGLISSLLSSFMSNYLLSRMEAFKMSLFVNLGTFLSIIAGVIFLHEQLKYFHFIGAFLIIGGVFGVHSREKKQTIQKVEVEIK